MALARALAEPLLPRSGAPPACGTGDRTLATATFRRWQDTPAAWRCCAEPAGKGLLGTSPALVPRPSPPAAPRAGPAPPPPHSADGRARLRPGYRADPAGKGPRGTLPAPDPGRRPSAAPRAGPSPPVPLADGRTRLRSGRSASGRRAQPQRPCRWCTCATSRSPADCARPWGERRALPPDTRADRGAHLRPGLAVSRMGHERTGCGCPRGRWREAG